jgi:arylsulfatase A-like enzyme
MSSSYFRPKTGLQLLLLAILWTQALVLTAAQPKSNPSRPNIVFIIADDLGWADVGFHGGNAPTPVLDRLAREGLEMTQHYVAPVCSPTRTGLLTGRCWSRFGVTSPQNDQALPNETVTLPGALQTLGYDTCLTGKWHLGSLQAQGPNHFGFDHSYGSLAGGVSPWNHRYKQGPFTNTWHRNEKLLEEKGHVTDLIAAEASGWLSSRQDQPFFLYVPFTAVHLPLKEPEEWLKRVPDSITGDVPRHYAASVMHLDDAVGKILATIEKNKQRENTLIVFTSDNGGSTVENNDLKYPDDNCPSGKLPGSNRPWRGQKGDLYEGGTRVPTVVQWPGRIKPGKNDTAVQIIDWMPTFCALADYRAKADLKWDGVDLSGVLREGKELPERPLYSVAPGWRARSLRLANWKLIVHGAGAARKVELFNLAADPAEARNLAEAEPAKAAQLMEAMEKIAARDRDSVVSNKP